MLWLEEPLIPGDPGNYPTLRQRTSTALSAGERLYSRWDFQQLINSRGVDVIQPDVSHVGGIWELRMIGAMAEVAQIAFAPHNPSGPVANAATLQIAATTPSFSWLETMATDVTWRRDIAQESHPISQGTALISNEPGLGVDINIDALKDHPYQRHDLRHTPVNSPTSGHPSQNSVTKAPQNEPRPDRKNRTHHRRNAEPGLLDSDRIC